MDGWMDGRRGRRDEWKGGWLGDVIKDGEKKKISNCTADLLQSIFNMTLFSSITCVLPAPIDEVCQMNGDGIRLIVALSSLCCGLLGVFFSPSELSEGRRADGWMDG